MAARTPSRLMQRCTYMGGAASFRTWQQVPFHIMRRERNTLFSPLFLFRCSKNFSNPSLPPSLPSSPGKKESQRKQEGGEGAACVPMQ